MLSNEIREGLQKVCAKLNKFDVEYIIVGGVAVGYHGFQRASGIELYKPSLKTDLDFWYNPTTENFSRLVKALIELGVDADALNSIVFDSKKTFLKIPHKDFHTDFLCQMDGLPSFREALLRASIETLDGNKLTILSLNDIISNKAAVGRSIDKRDITELEKIQKQRKGPRLS